MVLACVAVRLVASTSFRVKLKVPAAVGVPVIVPAEEDSDSPGGSVPEATVQVNGVASMMPSPRSGSTSGSANLRVVGA